LGGAEGKNERTIKEEEEGKTGARAARASRRGRREEMKRKAGGAWSEKAVVGGAHAQRPADVPPHQAWSSSAEGMGARGGGDLLLARREKKLFLVPSPTPPAHLVDERRRRIGEEEEEEEEELSAADVCVPGPLQSSKVSKIRATPAGDRPQKRRRSAEEEEEETLDRELQAITREVLDLGTFVRLFVCSFIHTPTYRFIGLVARGGGVAVWRLIDTLSGATQFKRKKQKRAYEERKIISLGGQVMAVALLSALCSLLSALIRACGCREAGVLTNHHIYMVLKTSGVEAG
jgi:hypothetical protein